MRRECSALLALISIFLTDSVSGQDLEIGKWQWIDHCSKCHGDEGKPSWTLVPDISLGEGIEKTFFEQLLAVRNGIGSMPGFANKLSDENIVDIVAYMMTLYPKKPKPLVPGDPNFM